MPGLGSSTSGGILDTDLNGGSHPEDDLRYSRNDLSLTSLQGPQNPGRVSEAEHDILANDLNRHLSFRKDCIDFVQALLRTVAINTQRPAYDDLMDVFDKVRKQGGVVVDAEVGKRSHSAEAHGGISGNSATLRVASISFAEGEVMSAARGNIMLAETLHFAAKQGGVLDSELAWAGYQVAWAQGYNVAPPPATNHTEKNSNYFHNTLQFAACNPYQKKEVIGGYGYETGPLFGCSYHSVVQFWSGTGLARHRSIAKQL